jgi:hypothetical protein
VQAGETVEVHAEQVLVTVTGPAGEALELTS